MFNFKSYLEEGRDAPLYHATPLFNAEKILQHNIIRAQTSHVHDWTTKKQGKVRALPVVSLTRSFKFAERWGERVSVRNRFDFVIFELDQRKLSQRYKFVPYNHFSGNPYGGTFGIEHPVARHVNDELDSGFPVNQYEENVIDDIKNAEQYIVKIYTPKNEALIDEIDYPLLRNHPKLYSIKAKKFVNV